MWYVPYYKKKQFSNKQSHFYYKNKKDKNAGLARNKTLCTTKLIFFIKEDLNELKIILINAYQTRKFS